MKFACLGYMQESKWNEMSDSQRDQMVRECLAYDDALAKAGNWLEGGQALQSASTAKTVRWEAGKVLVTDGPFAETREQLGGLGLLEARDMEHAVELMSKHPSLRYGGLFEIRPVNEQFHAEWASRHPKPAPRQIYINLPVKDLNRSVAFFTKLGFSFNPTFTDNTATCMIVSDTIYVMLLTEAKFKKFTPRALCDANTSTETLLCLSCDSRQAVDEMVRNAVAAGGSTYTEAKDYGFMYQHGFADPDGHIWELVYMSGPPPKAEGG